MTTHWVFYQLPRHKFAVTISISFWYATLSRLCFDLWTVSHLMSAESHVT